MINSDILTKSNNLSLTSRPSSDKINKMVKSRKKTIIRKISIDHTRYFKTASNPSENSWNDIVLPIILKRYLLEGDDITIAAFVDLFENYSEYVDYFNCIEKNKNIGEGFKSRAIYALWDLYYKLMELDHQDNQRIRSIIL
jgi:hypothetical protein